VTQSLLSVFLAAAMATAPVYADDGFNFIGGGGQTENAVEGQAEKSVKASREVNPFSVGSPMTQAAAAGAGLVFLGPIGAIGVPVATIMITKNEQTNVDKINAFYAGTVLRGKVEKVFPLGNSASTAQFLAEIQSSGIDPATVPLPQTIGNNLIALRLDVDGPKGSDRIVVARKDAGYVIGDILDAKIVVKQDLLINYNKQMPRAVGIYCKHDNPTCQNDYDSSLGVLYRHTDTEFPSSQYLIDPAIIAADQARMRKEEADKKAAQNSGGFNFM